MATRISKTYRAGKHVGWKKTVGGRECFLGYGTSAADEAKAKRLAEALDAKWTLAKAAGHSVLGDSDIDEAKTLIAGLPTWKAAQPAAISAISANERTDLPVNSVAATFERPASRSDRKWLFAALEEFAISTRKLLKHDLSNGDHVINTIERINRARDAMQDMPLDIFRQKELDDWLAGLRQLKSKQTGQPLSATTIRNLATAIKAALGKFVKWEWWRPAPDWRDAFKDYSIKKLQTPTERKRRRSRPPIHGVAEKRLLWHIALDFDKAMMALADWAGHTQKEIATLTFPEIQDDGTDMYIDRDRNKTGVHGRWWIPPEAAVYIRRVIATTSRDPAINPLGLAFLTPSNMPLVHRASAGKHARSDLVGSLWSRLLRISSAYDVQHISFKGLRKATAQLIRDMYDKEVSRPFLAHSDEDVQDEHYTRASIEKVEIAVRRIYEEKWKLMFEPMTVADWPVVRRQIRESRGLPLNQETAA